MRTYLSIKVVAVLLLATILPLYAQSQKTKPAETSSQKLDRINVRLRTIETVLTELSDRVNKLIVLVGERTVPSPIPPGKPTPEPPEGTEREPVPESVFAILSRNCAMCHAPPLIKEAGGGFAMFSDPSEVGKELKLLHLSPEDWVRIDYSIYSGDMPQYAEPLPSADTEEVRAYVSSIRDEVYKALGGKPK